MQFRLVMLAVLVGVYASGAAFCDEADEKIAKEFKLLEGIWAEDPPKGDGRLNAVQFKDGRMGWKSTRYQGGEPLIGHSKVYSVKIDPSTKPKQVTLTRGDGEERESRLGIYEIDGETLKMALGREKNRPANLNDKDTQLLTMKKVKSGEK